jgi:hypothetical protein
MANINELLRDHVTLEVECMDRIYLNGYVPGLLTGGQLVTFMMERLGKRIPSPALLGKITQGFVEAVKQFAADKGIPLIKFEHKQRKDDLANDLRAKHPVRDQVVFIGVAQEKAQAFSGRKRDRKGFVGFDYQRDKSVYVNHYYFYIDDEDFGPVFIKVCSYAPWGRSRYASMVTNGPSVGLRRPESHLKRSTTAFGAAKSRRDCRRSVIPLGRRTLMRCFANGSGGFRSL